MSLKDYTKYFEGLTGPPTPTEAQVPNTVSRSVSVGDRAFSQVVSESGKPVLDCELNAHTDITWMQNYLLQKWQVQSGWLRGRTHNCGYCDYSTEDTPTGVTDNNASSEDPTGTTLITVGGKLINALVLPKIEAVVAGLPVVVEYTYTNTASYNLVALDTPTIYDGTNATVKRTDFVFLEVWRSLVAPSPYATGYVHVVDSSTLVAGDQILINGNALTSIAAGPPGVDEFVLDAASEANTATNIVNAINDAANSFSTQVSAAASSDKVNIQAFRPGAGSAIAIPSTGNHITLAVNFAGGGTVGSWLASGATLTGGADRANKPSDDQDKIFRHGNVLSPENSWLDDQMMDPTLDTESSQRIQVQYRIRHTGFTEAVNFKTHPDGFSNRVGGNPSIYAQAGRSGPVYSGNPAGDTNTYPFVPADKSATWLQSSAVAYGIEDDGLWVAGDGSEQSAQDLGAVDGFVYAIPVCFVFRHNDASDPTAAVRGFDPENNTNGAPLSDHSGFNGVLGAIAAGDSDRPDGQFADVITQENLLDLRRHVVFPGVDIKAETQYQMQSLLDGNLRTWAVDAASKNQLGGSSGDVSTRFLVCNEFGRSTVTGGTPPFTGDTSWGDLVRNFDHIARRFADQPVIERHVVAFYPGDRPDALTQGGAVAPGLDNLGKYVTKYENPAGTVADADAWYEGDTLVLDLENLLATSLGGLWQGLDGDGDSSGLANTDIETFAPTGTVITDILSLYHDDGHYTTAVDQQVQASLIRGLGTNLIEITLDANDSTVNGGDSGNSDQRMVGRDTEITLPAGTDFTFADTNPDTIIRNDGGSFDAEGFEDGMVLTIANATNPANDGTYTIDVGGVAAGTLTLILGDTLTADVNDLAASISIGPVVPTTAAYLGSRRRIFVEYEVTYPIGEGLTDTPDYEVVPDPDVYGITTGITGPGPQIETSTSQRPADFEELLEPRFREGYREVMLEYCANDTTAHGAPNPGSAVGSITPESVVSRDRTTLYFPRRLYSGNSGVQAGLTEVTDGVLGVLKAIDHNQTDFGSSSRLVTLSTLGGATQLSGTGQTLCDIEYFPQDPIPNYGAAGAGYQIAVYYRTNAPQTAGTQEGNILTSGDGVLPTTLNVEPLLMSDNVWTGQVGMGGHDLSYPYISPLDQIPVNDGGSDSTFEWFFAASAEIAIDDFNANTGLLALHPFVQGDIQEVLTFGGTGVGDSPRKDAEFRAYYPVADPTSYRPTILSQPLYGATRHKVIVPLLARAVEDVPGVDGGLLFRKSELLLVVLSRLAELDDENNVRFLDTDNRTCAALYRTRNLLLLVGDDASCHVT